MSTKKFYILQIKTFQHTKIKFSFWKLKLYEKLHFFPRFLLTQLHEEYLNFFHMQKALLLFDVFYCLSVLDSRRGARARNGIP